MKNLQQSTGILKIIIPGTTKAYKICIKLKIDYRLISNRTLLFPFKRKYKIINKIFNKIINKIFQCHDPKGIKLVTRLRLGLSHLREHKFKHSFQDTLNLLCSCGVDIETTSHYFLHCSLFHAERSSLLNNINEIDSNI